MSEAKQLEENRALLQRLKDFCFGNGQTGAKERLTAIEKTINSEEVCAVGRVVKKHIEQHEKNRLFLWGIMVPVWVTLLAIILELIGVI